MPGGVEVSPTRNQKSIFYQVRSSALIKRILLQGLSNFERL